MNPPPDSVIDFRVAELALLAGGAVVTLMVVALAIWLFVRASREEREQVERDRREAERRRACAEDRDAGGADCGAGGGGAA